MLRRIKRGIVRDSSTSLGMTNSTRVACGADTSKTFAGRQAASTETDAEFLDPFDYAQGGLRSE